MTNRTYPDALHIHGSQIASQVETFIKDQKAKTGLHHIVLGLSGGVDSAVVAALCARALGPDSVHPYFLPYATSSPESRVDAQAVARRLNLTLESVDITPMADAFFNGRNLDSVRRGNVMARLRMTVLFDAAKEHEALVAGTGNKTETYLGYCTWYGDSACSFLPIADLYKSQVWQVAEFLDIPASVISKSPTADLWPGQTDETELGIEYLEVDQILHALLERKLGTPDIVALGFDPARVEHVVRLMHESEFKRTLPPVARIRFEPPDSSPHA